MKRHTRNFIAGTAAFAASAGVVGGIVNAAENQAHQPACVVNVVRTDKNGHNLAPWYPSDMDRAIGRAGDSDPGDALVIDQLSNTKTDQSYNHIDPTDRIMFRHVNRQSCQRVGGMVVNLDAGQKIPPAK